MKKVSRIKAQLIDCDYLKTLPPEASQWMDSFLNAYYRNDCTGQYACYAKETYKRDYAARQDILGRKLALGMVDDIHDPDSQIVCPRNTEDNLIGLIDARNAYAKR